MIKLEIKNLPNGVNYTKDDTGGSAQMQIDAVPRGTPLWVSGRTIKNPGKTQTMNNWRIRRQIKRLCCHGNQGRSVVVFSVFEKIQVRYTEN